MMRRPGIMEVTCERCGAHYDLDETLVGPKGTPVLCTSCGHRFRVPAALTELDPEDSVIWRVRRGPDGGVRELRSLVELKQAIRSGEVAPDDEIARGDRPWKALGDIPELGPAFADAGADGAEGTATVVSPPPPAMDPGTTRRDRTPPGGPAAQATLAGHHGTSANEAEATRTEATGGEPGRRVAGPRLDVPPIVPSDPPRTGPRRWSPGSSAAHRPPTTRPGRGAGRRQTALIAAGVIAVLGVTVWAQWDRLAPLVGLAPAPDAAGPFLERARAANRRGTPDGWAEATREATRASAVAERDPRVLVTLARAQARWAQALRFEVADLRVRREAARGAGENAAGTGDQDDPRREARISAMVDEATRRAGDARRAAEDAVRMAPDDPDARLVLADAMRLEGDIDGARAQLARARASETPPDGSSAARLTALLNGDGSVPALPPARQAVAQDPEDLDLRILLARALLGAGDVPEARRTLRGVLAARPAQARARRLLDAIEAGRPPAPPVVAVLDADDPRPGPGAGGDVAGTQGDPNAPSADGLELAADPSGAPPEDAGYSWFVRAGDEALDDGDPTLARRRFEQALDKRSGGLEALAGLGWVDLELGDVQGAVGRFRSAAEEGLPAAWLGLAETARIRGDDRAVLDALSRYVAAVPRGARADAARREIVVLRGRLAAGDGPSPGDDGDPGVDQDPEEPDIEEGPTRSDPSEPTSESP